MDNSDYVTCKINVTTAVIVTFPDKVLKCMCDHPIVENCYISKDFDINTLLIIGNCCIKKFIKASSRTCENCNAPHKNRSLNYCNNCKDYIKRGFTKKCVSCHSLNKRLTSNNCGFLRFGLASI